MARVSRLTAFPVKSLDGCDRDRVRLGPGGAIVGDRTYALFESDVAVDEASVAGGGGYVNGKSERQVHELRASYETAAPTDATPTRISIGKGDGESTSFGLPDESGELGSWLTEFFGYPVRLERMDAGFPDDATDRGPTFVSRATLEEVASWFDGVDAEEMQRRLRVNVVIDDVPAFWEDRLFADRDSHVRFRVGDATFEGVKPCRRCVVPSRDPDTGEELPNFRETFVTRRRETVPDWSGGDRFDHYYRLMVNTTIPDSEVGAEIGVGDDVEILDTVAAPDAD